MGNFGSNNNVPTNNSKYDVDKYVYQGGRSSVVPSTTNLSSNSIDSKRHSRHYSSPTHHPISNSSSGVFPRSISTEEHHAPPEEEKKHKPSFLGAFQSLQSDDSEGVPMFLRMRQQRLQAYVNKDENVDFKECSTAIMEEVEGNKKINQYTILKSIGKGSYAKVKLCCDENDQLFAMKILDKPFLKKTKNQAGGNAYEDVIREVSILKRLNHKNVVKLFEAIDDPNHDQMYLIMEYLENGPVLQSDSDKLEEVIAKHAFRDCLEGLQYLHERCIIHRDLKPENLLMDSNQVVKITDFGVSCIFKGEDDMVKSTAGSLAFFSPEICNGLEYSGRMADIYALGVCLFNFVCGMVPFQANSIKEMYDQITNSPVEPILQKREEELKLEISQNCKDLICRMMEKDPQKRISILEIWKHPWMAEFAKDKLI